MKTRHLSSTQVPRRGFALVITSMLMVLVTVLAVSLLSLTAVTLRGSNSDQWRAEARANARLALMLAIGDLQKETGPDQRITANARVLEKASNPQWLGTWDSWNDWLNADGIRDTYGAGRTSRFRRWLVSHPDQAALSKSDTVSQTAVEAATMVGSTGDVEAVRVPKVPVRDGAFSWWIAGENQKARAAETGALQNSYAQLGGRSSWPGDGIEWLEGLDKLETSAEVLAKAVSLSTLGVSNGDRAIREKVDEHFHDLTTDSVGLLANVRHGGLKKDLNLLLERRSLPAQFGTFGASKPGGSVVSIRDEKEDVPRAFYGSQNPNFPSWYKLRQYYSLYKAEGDETAQDCIPLPFKRGLWGNGSPNANFHWDRGNFDQFGWARTPILSRLMMVFSTRRTPSRTPGRYDYKLGVNPVVVLWNPYNVTLRSGRQFIEIGPGSLEYKAYVNGRQSFDWKKVRLSTRSDGQGVFKVRVYPMEGPGQAYYEKPIILKPGETRIYSARSGFIQADNQYHVELYPGYQPPEADGGFDVPIDGFTNIDGGSRVELAMRISDSRTENDGVHQIYYVARNGQTGDQQRYSEMAGSPIEDGKPMPVLEDSPGQRVVFPSSTQRVPFASFQFVLKSAEDLRNPGIYGEQDYRCKNFIHANPVNQRAAYGEATDRMRGLSQYHIHVEQGAGNALNPDFDPATNRAYLGSAISLGNSTWPGQPSVVTTELPAVPVTSIASLMHFKLNPGKTSFASERHLWDVSVNQALGIGNSFAHPLIPATSVYQDLPDLASRGGSDWLEFKLARDCYDHAFLNNDALWDDWFCSTIAPQSRGVFAEERSLKEVVHDFISGEKPLPNSHLRRWDGGLDAGEPSEAFIDGNEPADEAWQRASSHLVLDGAFNINSTSVAAWQAFLGGLKDEELLYLDPDSGSVRSAKLPDDRVVFSRFSLPCSPEEGDNAGDPASWLGVRLLTREQIGRLANECVRQVKLRGPFLNLSDFVNRRLQDGELGSNGALQAAIDWDDISPNPSSINGRFKSGDDMIPSSAVAAWGLPFPLAATGSRFTGIPGYLTQGDVLKRIGNMITPRDDTFRVRGYGEARDDHGKVMARAWCEAVVQRVPEYLDSSDKPQIATKDLRSDLNRRFGRQLKLVSFRWLPEAAL
jgi:hypothetical protein